MGQKIIILVLIVLSAVTGCADFDLHIKNEARGVKPAVILIGKFDTRNMNYDPFVAEEFRDAVKFEYFKKGYNCLSLKSLDEVIQNESEWATKVCSDNKGDLLVTGVISQRESGFLADRKTDTLITFTIFNKTGAMTGKGFYHIDESDGDESVRRGAASKFVSELLSSFEKSN